MDLNLQGPPVLQGSEREQLRQVHTYLTKMQRELVVAFDGFDAEALANQAAAAVQGGAGLPDGGDATVHEAYRQLKALIIKTADTITLTMDELRTRLESDYVANSTFGTYAEQASNEMRATATEVVQNYQYDSKLQALQGSLNDFNASLGSLNSALQGSGDAIVALESYNIATEQYIKTGLLFFDAQNIPRYGVAVGENLTKVVVNGQTVIERTGLAATFTSDRLSFWQNDVEVAYVSNNQLYIQEARILSRLFLGNWVIETTNGFTIKWVDA